MAEDNSTDQQPPQSSALAAIANALLRLPATLYHYCPNDAFVEIVTKRTVRISALSLSNDSREGRLVGEAVIRLAEKDKLGMRIIGGLGAGVPDFPIARLRAGLEYLEKMFDGLGFCLSAEGDLLSQWRGYADDGRGVSIGFSRSYWEKRSKDSVENAEDFGFSLRKVLYEPTEHEAQVEPTYQELRELINSGELDIVSHGGLIRAQMRTAEEIAADNSRNKAARMKMLSKLLELFPKLHILKSAAFKEEQEWRLVSAYVTNTEEVLSYRARGASVVPFRDIDVADVEGESSITEVVLGPRHITPPEVIQAMLRQHGFGIVPVRKSAASYR